MTKKIIPNVDISRETCHDWIFTYDGTNVILFNLKQWFLWILSQLLLWNLSDGIEAIIEAWWNVSIIISNKILILPSIIHDISNITTSSKLSSVLWHNFHVLNNDIPVKIINFLHLKMLIDQMCMRHWSMSLIMFSFYAFVNFSNAHICFVPYHVQFFVNFSNVYVCFAFRYVHFFSILNLSNVLGCMLMCECICLFLSSSVVCLLFDTL